MQDKIKGKLDKHFNIIIEEKKTPILSYKISHKNGMDILTLKTKIKSEIISELAGRIDVPTKISIPTENSVINITGEFIDMIYSPMLYEIRFKIKT